MADRIDGFDVSRETAERLETYAALVRKWNPRINLVAKSTIEHLETRHIADCLQLAPFTNPGLRWLDIGTGGGLPGLVIAAVEPLMKVTLIESDQRKTVFLREAARQMELDVDIRCDRIESSPQPEFDIVSARALAPLDRLFPWASPWLKPGGRFVFMKGGAVQSEIDKAAKHWQFSFERLSSITSAEGAILVIKDLRRA